MLNSKMKFQNAKTLITTSRFLTTSSKRIAMLMMMAIFIGCEKEVNIDLTSKDKLVVIEGTIESNQQPYVYLTNSIGFFDKIDLNSVGYIKNANITVTDITTGVSVELKEYNIDTLVWQSSIFIYNLRTRCE